jgi:inositol 1,4,5-triphosphate receptor type 1/inositol 1,4,5-triphosphate receptor type 3
MFCFLYTFDWTFKANAGVGGYFSGLEDNGPDPPAEKYNWGRFLFDNSSNIFLVIIMVNIVAGIIIDTFGSLREEEGDKMRDIEDKCFICGNLKTTFDRLSDNAAGGGFAHHIRVYDSFVSIEIITCGITCFSLPTFGKKTQPNTQV